MNYIYRQIIDANINRVCEGLRVIEDYTRFSSQQKSATDTLARLRKQISHSETEHVRNLLPRNTGHDLRAGEVPAKRPDIVSLLKANFKRVQEGLRVLEEYAGNPLYNAIRYQVYNLEKEVILRAMRPTLDPGVYLISHDLKILEQGLKWKVSAIQLRDKTSPKQIILKKALSLAPKAKRAGVPFIVNDHLDIALASDADGLHTGQDDLDLVTIRKLLGPHKLIGRSSHNLKQGLAAQAAGADYLGIGPIWSTPTKPEGKAIGFQYLRVVKKNIRIPYVIIGGVNLKSIKQLAQFRPRHVAVISAWREIPNITKLLLKREEQ